MAHEEKSYNVGNLTSYKKGQSGNPKGKPKGAKNRATLAKKWMTAVETAKNPITRELEALTQEDLMFLSMIYAVRSKQDVRAFEVLMDARFGKISPDPLVDPEEESQRVNRDKYITFEVVDPVFDQVKELEVGANK